MNLKFEQSVHKPIGENGIVRKLVGENGMKNIKVGENGKKIGRRKRNSLSAKNNGRRMRNRRERNAPVSGILKSASLAKNTYPVCIC